jgi:hypothetical protein
MSSGLDEPSLGERQVRKSSEVISGPGEVIPDSPELFEPCGIKSRHRERLSREFLGHFQFHISAVLIYAVATHFPNKFCLRLLQALIDPERYSLCLRRRFAAMAGQAPGGAGKGGRTLIWINSFEDS